MLGGVEHEIVDVLPPRRRGAVLGVPDVPPLMAELSTERSTPRCSTARCRSSPACVERLEAGIDVADIGCGSGYAMNVLAAPSQQPLHGLRLLREAIAAGPDRPRVGARQRHLRGARRGRPRGPRAFDFVTTFDAVHDQAHPAPVLPGIADALRPDGVYLCVDVAASSHLEDNVEHPLGR